MGKILFIVLFLVFKGAFEKGKRDKKASEAKSDNQEKTEIKNTSSKRTLENISENLTSEFKKSIESYNYVINHFDKTKDYKSYDIKETGEYSVKGGKVKSNKNQILSENKGEYGNKKTKSKVSNRALKQSMKTVEPIFEESDNSECDFLHDALFLRNAVIMKEILDPPLAKRNGRRCNS